MAGNIYDPTQGQGEGFNLDDAMEDPDFLELLSKMGYLPGVADMPGGRSVGGTFRAAHPLEFASAAAQNLIRGIKGPQMNRALANALRNRKPRIPSTWGYEGADFSPGGTHEGWT
jgi:hypothetical protein